jgi:hypothetical protein
MKSDPDDRGLNPLEGLNYNNSFVEDSSNQVHIRHDLHNGRSLEVQILCRRRKRSFGERRAFAAIAQIIFTHIRQRPNGRELLSSLALEPGLEIPKAGRIPDGIQVWIAQMPLPVVLPALVNRIAEGIQRGLVIPAQYQQ